MNTRNIQPKEIWADGQKSATILGLVNFTNYHFDGGEGTVIYKLIGMENGAAVDYYMGSVNIPSDIISQWGEDDTIIWNYVAQKLELTII